MEGKQDAWQVPLVWHYLISCPAGPSMHLVPFWSVDLWDMLWAGLLSIIQEKDIIYLHVELHS